MPNFYPQILVDYSMGEPGQDTARLPSFDTLEDAEKFYLENDNYEYQDNFAFCRIHPYIDSEKLGEFIKAYQQGCCGYETKTIIIRQGICGKPAIFLISFNHGH